MILGFTVLNEVRMRAGEGSRTRGGAASVRGVNAVREAAVPAAHPPFTRCISNASAVSSLPGKEKNIPCQSVVKITPY